MSKRTITRSMLLAGVITLGCIICFSAACSSNRSATITPAAVSGPAAGGTAETTDANADGSAPGSSASEAAAAVPQNAGSTAAAATAGSLSAPESQETAVSPSEPSEKPSESGQAPDKKLIVIDAGHQGAGNSGLEPVGPGASELKAKVSSGTVGSYTGLPEYQLNLEVALKLQAALEAAGYDVIMIRTTNDVDISNSRRAQIANEAGADAFIRVHANGSTDPSENGVLTICQTESNPFNGGIYGVCRALSSDILKGVAAATGADDRGVWETDTMSGINWCTVPVTILEMGYMTNEREDRLLSTEDYQDLIVRGIVTGLALFFEEPDAVPTASAPVTAASENGDLSELEKKIDNSIGSLTSQWDVYIERLTDGAAVSCSHDLPEDGRMVAASIIKLFVMATVYEQVSLGTFSEDSSRVRSGAHDHRQRQRCDEQAHHSAWQGQQRGRLQACQHVSSQSRVPRYGAQQADAGLG